MTALDPLTQLADTVTRLLHGWSTVTTTPAWDDEDEDAHGTAPDRTGRIDHPGLVTQLYAALTDATPSDEETTYRPIPDSRLPFPDQPFDVLLAIERFERANAPLNRIVGHTASQPDLVVKGISLEVLALARRAEIALGHQYAPRRLRGACPVCNTKDKLLVNRDANGDPTDAYCEATSCDATWDKDTLELLARILSDAS